MSLFNANSFSSCLVLVALLLSVIMSLQHVNSLRKTRQVLDI